MAVKLGSQARNEILQLTRKYKNLKYSFGSNSFLKVIMGDTNYFLKFLSWQTFRRYIRFGIVGASGVAVDMAVLFLLSDPKMLGLNLSLGKALAAEVALISNFVWNELWTFGDISAIDSRWCARFGRFIKFNLICLAGIALSILLLNLQVRLITMNVYASNFVAIIVVSFWNFGMNLKFGWNKSASTSREKAPETKPSAQVPPTPTKLT